MKEIVINRLRQVARQVLPRDAHIWLYGSQARGEAYAGSDWDLLILLDKDKIAQDDFDKISFPLIETGWNLGVDVSPQMYTKKEWTAHSFFPFQQNVERDKIVLV